jgi:hypothetical protein
VTFLVGAALAAKALYLKTFAAKAAPTLQILKLIALRFTRLTDLLLENQEVK